MVFLPNKPRISINPIVFSPAIYLCLKPAVTKENGAFQKQLQHKLISSKLFATLHAQQANLTHRIAKNMSDDLRKHNQAHLDLFKMRFDKSASFVSRSFSQLNQI